MFWKKTIINQLVNNIFLKKFLKEKNNSGNLIYLKNKELEKINQEEQKFLDNLNKYKNRLNKNDLSDINNWGSYKKKLIFKSNYRTKKTIKEPLILKIKSITYLINTFKNIKSNWIINYKKTSNNFFLKIKKKLFLINLNKILLIEKKKYFSINKILYLIIDIRFLKTKIICFNKQKCLFTITNGLVFKKMNLKNKKNKKSEKTTNLLLKSLNNKMGLIKSYKKIIIYIKGVKKYLTNMLKYINTNIKKDSFFMFIHNSKISKYNHFNFKKIKAIKKRLKKKIVKLK